jgi:hypothetical protein
MKKAELIAIFCIFVMCSGTIVGIAAAGSTVYTLLEYASVTPATIDGKWTTTDEWTDAYIGPLSFNGIFGYDLTDFTDLGLEWLIEPFFDNTNNTGDIVQICLDNLNDGGTTPKTDDFKIEITGHTTGKLYKGTGTGWTEVTSEIVWKDTLTTSPKGNQTHWVIEVRDPNKTTGSLITDQPPNGMRIAYFDAATNQWSDWAPNGSGDQPSTYGTITTFSMDPIPEGFSIAIIAVLSFIAVVGALALRRSKTSSYFFRSR